MTFGDVTVRFDDATRTFSVTHEEGGVLLADGVVRARIGGRAFSTNDKSLDYSTTLLREIRCDMVIAFEDLCSFTLCIMDDNRFGVRVDGPLEGPAEVALKAYPEINAANEARGRTQGNLPILGILDSEREADNGVLLTTLGQPGVTVARSLFDPEKDFAITASVGDWIGDKADGWELHSAADAGVPLLFLDLHPHYYRDTLGIEQYAPIEKRAKWPVAPVVAMTWYGIKGWEGKPAQTKEWLYPNIDWCAEHLLPYAETLVFQLDDNYYTDNDPYMRDISDYIRSKGLAPGIWFTPYTVAPKEVHDDHPDWFIHGKDGKPLGSFGGVSYRDHYTLNVTSPGAVENWFDMWWRKASETWNFDFFKIDGQPQVIDRYKQSTDGGGIDGYRVGLEIARKIVGPEKFINGCWGIPLAAIGKVDGSRTGGDTGNYPHAIDIILHWQFLNNVCWWSDPDAAANLYRATVERTRLNAQARVLTGQQFLTDDVWTSVPPQIARVWQLSYPTLDIKPVNLYKIEGDWKRYDVFDLRIAKPWGTFDVAGLFNYDGVPTEKELDLSRLPLEASEVHVYEFWQNQYLGRHANDAKLRVYIAPYEGKLYSIVPVAKDRPQLISTSRYVTQGGLDLDHIALAKRGDGWLAEGRSSHLVAGDPYELRFAGGSYKVVAARSDAGEAEAASGWSVETARIHPRRSGEADWRVLFAPIEGADARVVPASIELGAGEKRTIEIVSRGPKEVRWTATPSDERVRISPTSGKLGAWPASGAIEFSVDDTGLDRGETWTGAINVGVEGKPGDPFRVLLTVHVPPPTNHAMSARARASSQWNLNYKADRANDGLRNTRWNSQQGDVAGAWYELAWDKPVEFNRIVIDECIDYGPRIQEWHVEAGDGGMKEIARGTTAGRNRTIDLERPIKAKRLRLTIDKASTVPTIWEVEVFNTTNKD